MDSLQAKCLLWLSHWYIFDDGLLCNLCDRFLLNWFCGNLLMLRHTLIVYFLESSQLVDLVDLIDLKGQTEEEPHTKPLIEFPKVGDGRVRDMELLLES